MYQYGTITVGILVFAFANLVLVVPNTIMNGGVMGLSQMGYYLWEWNIGRSVFLLNLPLFIMAFVLYRHLFFNSVFGLIVSSVLIGILQTPLVDWGIRNIWLASTVGGFIMGFGLGMIASRNASLGGGALLTSILHNRFGWPMGKLFFWIDSAVYPIGFVLIGWMQTIFSVVLTIFSALGMHAAVTLLGKKRANSRSSSPEALQQ